MHLVVLVWFGCGADRDIVEVEDGGWFCLTDVEPEGGDGMFSTIGEPSWLEVVVPVDTCIAREIAARCNLDGDRFDVQVSSDVAYKTAPGDCGPSTLVAACARPFGEGHFTFTYGDTVVELDLPGDAPRCIGEPGTDLREAARSASAHAMLAP